MGKNLKSGRIFVALLVQSLNSFQEKLLGADLADPSSSTLWVCSLPGFYCLIVVFFLEISAVSWCW